ncbi:hypothetical protein HDV64DRAFT_243388 [Trichoderma sp. TUCIM 5745]
MLTTKQKQLGKQRILSLPLWIAVAASPAHFAMHALFKCPRLLSRGHTLACLSSKGVGQTSNIKARPLSKKKLSDGNVKNW